MAFLRLEVIPTTAAAAGRRRRPSHLLLGDVLAVMGGRGGGILCPRPLLCAEAWLPS